MLHPSTEYNCTRPLALLTHTAVNSILSVVRMYIASYTPNIHAMAGMEITIRITYQVSQDSKEFLQCSGLFQVVFPIHKQWRS